MAATPLSSGPPAAITPWSSTAGHGFPLRGNQLMPPGRPAELDLFYSHTHFDHICGLPFFAPCYDAASSMRIWAGHLNGNKGIEAVLNKMMIAPLFPIPM